MNVIVIIWSIRVGGAETFAVGLCRYLKERGYTPLLFPIYTDWDMVFYNSIREQGIEVLSPFTNTAINWIAWRLNAITWKLGLGNFRDWLNKTHFKYKTKRDRISAIISNTLVGDDFIYRNVGSRIPYVVVEHGEYCISLVEGRKIHVEGIKNADRVVSVSKWCQEQLLTGWGISSVLIYNGIVDKAPEDFVRIRSAYHKDITFSMIGRGVEQKGWLEAIKAFLLVKEVIRDCKLVLIGEGPFLEDLRKIYSNQTDIFFLGRVIDPQIHLMKSDIGLVLSRKYEAFGLTLLDFFSHSKPVIASRVGGIPEVVNFENKPAGILLNVNEEGIVNIDELKEKMLELSINNELRNAFGVRGKEIAKHFASHKTYQAYEELISSLIK